MMQVTTALAHEILEFLEDQEDVKDGPDGPEPNKAMSLAMQMRRDMGIEQS